MQCAAAVNPTDDVDAQLKQADSIKASKYPEFLSRLDSLEQRSRAFSAPQQQYLRYLQGWRSAYRGDYETAVSQLKSSIAESDDPTLRFRARVTLANVLAVATQYQEAFSQLSQFQAQLPEITNGDARQQGLAVAAFLYNQVGEYGLALSSAEMLIKENWGGKGPCRGGHAKLEALYRSGRLRNVDPEFANTIDACVNMGDPLRANTIRTYVARLYTENGRPDQAIELLQKHYEELREARYPRLISEYDSLLARAYQQQGRNALARQFAQRSIESGVKNQYTEPLVGAYRVLYQLAQQEGDVRSALAFHEKYALADKGYLDDVSARQIAYERVRHETLSNKLQIDSLNKENEVLQLQKELSGKAAETSRLYIALLLLVLGSIILWAWRTKRSQLHFMKLSQMDGLTGIANRPRFIDLAQGALEAGRKTQQQVSVLLCDLDHFKSINDKYGHATGDFVLKQVVSACEAHLRASDIFGRFGGEEFCVVLPGCGLEDARERAEQLRIAIAAIVVQHEGVDSNVSASFGIAATGLSGYELRQLLAHADAALYQAKNAGRNCVVLHDAKKGMVSNLAPVLDERLRGFAR